MNVKPFNKWKFKILLKYLVKFFYFIKYHFIY